jgi:acetyl esterase/lipase
VSGASDLSDGPVGRDKLTPLKTRFDIAYSEPDGFPLHLDLFHPDGETARPCVVCIHGGGWVSGDKSGYHDVAAPLAEQGFAAVCVQYRLAPQHFFPAACEDVAAAVKFLRANAVELGIDGGRIASLGNSAGGHLAAFVGLKEKLQAVVAISGVGDLTAPAEYHTDIGIAFAVQFLGALPAEAPELYGEASPMRYVTKDAPPFLLVHGEVDDIVPIGQSELMFDALQANGTPVEFMRCPNEAHSFTYPAWSAIERRYTDFLKQTFAPEP